jgi:hypothetical protein
MRSWHYWRRLIPANLSAIACIMIFPARPALSSGMPKQLIKFTAKSPLLASTSWRLSCVNPWARLPPWFRGTSRCCWHWIGPYISIHFLSLNPLLIRRRRYSRGKRYTRLALTNTYSSHVAACVTEQLSLSLMTVIWCVLHRYGPDSFDLPNGYVS